MVSPQQMQARDQAIMDEFRKTRDVAIDAVATRAINLRADLTAAMAEIGELKAKIATLNNEIGTLKMDLDLVMGPGGKRRRGARG